MNEVASGRSPIDRILVALDASSSSLNALHAAVELARRFNARVLGLFVEDIQLLRLAELPFVREISFFGPLPREIDPLEMALQLRIQADRIRRTLAQIADKGGIAWEFRTARGEVGTQVLSAAQNIDLVVLGKIGRSLPGSQRSGSTVRTLLMQRRGMTLIMQTGGLFNSRPVAVLFDGSACAGKALETAALLAGSHHSPLIVYVVGESIDALKRLQVRADKQLHELEIEVRFREAILPSPVDLAARIQKETQGPVIIPCLEDRFAGEPLCDLVDEIVNPVLLVR